jgi:hypothetical protein
VSRRQRELNGWRLEAGDTVTAALKAALKVHDNAPTAAASATNSQQELTAGPLTVAARVVNVPKRRHGWHEQPIIEYKHRGLVQRVGGGVGTEPYAQSSCQQGSGQCAIASRTVISAVSLLRAQSSPIYVTVVQDNRWQTGDNVWSATATATAAAAAIATTAGADGSRP